MRHDLQDLAGGVILTLIGLAVAGYAVASYDLGSLRRMGPGFFPTALGVGLAGLGAVIALSAWGRGARTLTLAWKETLAVLTSIAVFAAGLERMGLVGVTFGAVLIATLAAPDRRIAWRLALALVITALSVLVFHFGLKMTAPLWPVGFGTGAQ
ncbi:tripartite tricarboxylate transporter TctB family protein [Rhodobacter maris]|uniref:Tripartite tricarboxylate transporter TctB family protein n=1 Tax=Rhodobacter maris TaxID=446682 RepID=A0A285S575_9RHOB|nr:tripartite tricarboxylate transporter TctB family protein [Rhodobacter maris]SOC02415.1 tripartite tricarboxylate transporter TctB family protein [Rhodobacter maris]